MADISPTHLPTMPPSLTAPVTYAPTPSNLVSSPPTPTGFIVGQATAAPTSSPTAFAWTTTDTIIVSATLAVFAVLLGLFIWSYQVALASKDANLAYNSVSQLDPEAQPLAPGGGGGGGGEGGPAASSSGAPQVPPLVPTSTTQPPFSPARDGYAAGSYVPGSYVPGSKPIIPFKPAQHLA